jgi:glycosyltransferase involved in cell wall biosynthesis
MHSQATDGPTARPATDEKMAQRRVIQIIHSPDPGGVLALANTIAAGLARHGFKVETLFLTPRPGASLLTKLIGARSTLKQLRRNRDAAVISYQSGPSIIAALANQLGPGRTLIVHQTTVPSATSAPVRMLSALFGTFGLYPVNVVNTAFTRSEFDHYPASYRRRLELIEHGVEPPRLTLSRSDLLRTLAIPENERVLLNTGRLADQKGQDTIVRALVDLPGWHFVIAGEGERRSELERLARDLGVHHRLHLLGALPYEQVVQYYGIADIFVFPSLHETFGISAVEAAMLGVPTIAADITVLREVLTIDGETPVAFVAPGDVPAWVEAVKGMSDAPTQPALLKSFGERLAQRYSTDRMIDAYVRLLSC